MSKTALLLMDLQNGIVDRYCNDPEFIRRVQQVTATARKAAMPIIYVVVKFREQYPEVSPRNKAFGAVKSGALPLQEGDPAVEVSSSFAPESGDIIVTK